ncbi:Elongation factor Ts, mitochondrial, partial [Nowakowskiella sp. JEL0078]
MKNHIQWLISTRQLVSPIRSFTSSTRFCQAAKTVSVEFKPDMKLLSLLRKETQCAISKAREALVATNNNHEDALVWLTKDAVESGAKKASKLADRSTTEGLVGFVITDAGITPKADGSGFTTGLGALVEVNSETDFVARGEIFKNFVQKVGVTSAMFGSELSNSSLDNRQCIFEADPATVRELPISSKNLEEAGKTIKDLQLQAIGKLGENIQLRRISVVLPDSTPSDSLRVVAGYAHGDEGQNMGRIGALVVLKVSPAAHAESHIRSGVLTKFGRQLAQHVVGFSPTAVSEKDLQSNDDKTEQDLDELVMLRQNFLPSGGSLTIAQALSAFEEKEPSVKVEIESFKRYECGEG